MMLLKKNNCTFAPDVEITNQINYTYKSMRRKNLLLFLLMVMTSAMTWATDPTITITQSALGLTNSYTSNSEATIGGITFVSTDLKKYSTNKIEAKASTGIIYNTTAFPTEIKSVAISHTGTARSTTILGSADGKDWTSIKTGNGSIEGDFTDGSYYYFKITRGSSAAYWTQVVVTYSESGDSPDPPDPSITASNVNITSNASSGSIGYTLNDATGNVTANVTSGDWLTLGTVTASEVPFTCSANPGTTARTAEVTLSFTGAEDKVVTITQAAPIARGNCGASGHESEVTWILTEDGVLTISGTGEMDNSYSDFGQPWADKRDKIKSIVIDNGVISIGNRAFRHCSNLTSVTIPSSVIFIGDVAFNNCSSLTSVTLNSNPFISESAFTDIKEGATITMNLAVNKAEEGEYWTTFYNQNQNFQISDAVGQNTQIFKASLSGTKLTLTELTSDKKVTKNKPVILKSTASPIVLTLTTTDSGNNFDSNSLQGVPFAVGQTANGTQFVLNKGSQGVGFYKMTSGKVIGVGKAYLTYSGASAKEFFGFEEDATRVANVNVNDNDNCYYDLQGRCVSNGQWSMVNR